LGPWNAAALALPWLLAAAGPVPQPPVFGASSSLVVLSATAVDRKGRPVTNLRPDEFRVLEDGRPQRLERFAAGATLPARVLLLADASGSMAGGDRPASSRMAVVQVLAALGPLDEAALAIFDIAFHPLVPFTRDRAALLAEFDQVQRFGTTALHDALVAGADAVAEPGEGRRAVVVITDGLDNASQRTPDEVIERSRALEVPIYALAVVSPLDDPESDRFAGKVVPGASAAGRSLLERCATLSGGQSFVTSDFPGLKAAAEQVAAEVKHQYRLGYAPPEGPSRYRRIQVTTTRRGVVVRTRSGYQPLTSKGAP
jgi:Ca-activated chloride channel family protein